jgi:hypothetical protein
LNLDLNFYDEEEKDKFLKELNSKMDEQLFKGFKPENVQLMAFYKYLEILNKLVDIPSFNALKIEEDQIQQNFHIFFFFLISCKYELARYVHEQTKVKLKISFENMLLFSIYFLQNVWDKLFLALIALKIYTKSLELNDKYEDEFESEIKY